MTHVSLKCSCSIKKDGIKEGEHADADDKCKCKLCSYKNNQNRIEGSREDRKSESELKSRIR